MQRALVEAARGASRNKDSYLSAQYSRIARRRGSNKATIAVAHSILDVSWHLLTNGTFYDDPGARFYELRHDPEVEVRGPQLVVSWIISEGSPAEAKRLQRRIEGLGFEVTSPPPPHSSNHANLYCSPSKAWIPRVLIPCEPDAFHPSPNFTGYVSSIVD